MPTGLQEAPPQAQVEPAIPDFGKLAEGVLTPGKRYHARVYRLNPESARSLAEVLGFTAKFDSSGVRAACFDAHKGEGTFVCEVNRNTRPADVMVRYASDRWTPLDAVVSEPNRPWLKTTYLSSLPEGVMSGIAQVLKVADADIESFYIRINFKERLAGLIAEEQHAEKFPLGAFSTHMLPSDQIDAAPALREKPAEETLDFATTKDSRIERKTTVETTTAPKYATYSQSEIDRMLKVQGENVTAAVMAKVSSQQKNFQDAVDEQERNVKKLADKLLGQFEDSRMKNDASMKEQRETVRKEMAQFKSDLMKELEQFKAQLAKGLTPNTKPLDDKIKALEELLKKAPAAKAPAKAQPVEKDSRALYIAIAAVVLAAVNTALFFVKH